MALEFMPKTPCTRGSPRYPARYSGVSRVLYAGFANWIPAGESGPAHLEYYADPDITIFRIDDGHYVIVMNDEVPAFSLTASSIASTVSVGQAAGQDNTYECYVSISNDEAIVGPTAVSVSAVIAYANDARLRCFELYTFKGSLVVPHDTDGWSFKIVATSNSENKFSNGGFPL